MSENKGITTFLSVLTVVVLLITVFSSVVASSSYSYQVSNKIKEYTSCSTCSSDSCTNCSDAIEFVVEYAWEHMPPFPRIKWFHAYPITKFVSDVTIWAAGFALELQNGFKETCYKPMFIIADVVSAATQYALKEVLKMIHEILFIFYPAILAIAFIKAVVHYLKKVCNGTTPPDNERTNQIINFPRFSLLELIIQKINESNSFKPLFFYDSIKENRNWG